MRLIGTTRAVIPFNPTKVLQTRGTYKRGAIEIDVLGSWGACKLTFTDCKKHLGVGLREQVISFLYGLVCFLITALLAF
ncbi:hypothetical protein D3C80_1939270 [compost metagenome]